MEGAKIEIPLSKGKWKADAIQLETLLMTFEGAFKIAALEKSVVRRSSCKPIFCKLGVLKNSSKLPRNTCAGVTFS